MTAGFPATLDRLLSGEALDADGAHALMDQTLTGDLGPERLTALLTALRTRPPVRDELVGFARAMRDHAVTIDSGHDLLLDTCGTGGSPLKAFNVSTTTAFVLAAGGIPVAKHGNRSVTRPSGSADVLEAAGLDLALPPEKAADILRDVGIAFLFAPSFHPAMKHAGPVRQALGVKTVFNLLGPLANPAGATHQVLGVYDASLVPVMAGALTDLGVRGGVVLHGAPGFDEATPCGPITMAHIGDETDLQTLDPADLGIVPCRPDDIAAVPREEAPALMRSILEGSASTHHLDTVALNAAFGFHATGKTSSMQDGLEMARDVLASGDAAGLFDRYLEAAHA